MEKVCFIWFDVMYLKLKFGEMILCIWKQIQLVRIKWILFHSSDTNDNDAWTMKFDSL